MVEIMLADVYLLLLFYYWVVWK